MKTQKIYSSDLHHLIYLFTGEKTAPCIFDPNQRLIQDQVDGSFEPNSESRILVNLAGELKQYKACSLDEFDFIIDLGNAKVSSKFSSDRFCALNHPNGKMRWLYRANGLKEVLAFYNDAGWRGKFISKSIKLLSFFNLGKWIAKEQITVHSKKGLAFTQWLQQSEKVGAIFLGTPGIQQTALISIIEAGNQTRFLKIPLTKVSQQLIQNEKAALYRLAKQSYTYLRTPSMSDVPVSDVLSQENLKASGRKHEAEFTELHANALEELYQSSCHSTPLVQCLFWKQIQHNLQHSAPAKEELTPLYGLCRELASFIDETKSIVVSNCHGDFTPWNMLSDKSQIFLYDWELSFPQAPALLDLFHFHYQRGILMEHLSSKAIASDIAKAVQLEPIQRIVKNSKSDIDQLHRLYLLRTITYFINVYDQQELTVQNRWQLSCWEEALKTEIAKAKAREVGCRITFVEELNNQLKSIPHAFLKFDYDSLDELPSSSDLDIAIFKETGTRILAFAQNHSLVNRVRVHKKTFMVNAEIFFTDGEFLSIDLIHKFQRKAITMLPAKELILSSKMSHSGVRIPALKYDLAYTFLFYTLNQAAIPLRYYRLFEKASATEKKEALAYLSDRFSLKFNKLSSLFAKGVDSRSVLVENLNKSDFKNRFSGTLNYLVDTLKGFFKPTGFMITFSGVDGVGKSTVLQLVEEKLKNQFRKDVVLMRHRPGILPILSALKHGKAKAEQIASVTIPRKGKNQSKLSSILRFSYYFADYLFGQIYVYFRYIARGKVVLYDRYYFDFINDAKRSNIKVNRSFAKSLYAFILKPRLNVFLYADPQVVLSRKQELQEEDIVELSKNYLSLFRELGAKSTADRYTAIENLELRNTIAEIIKAYQKVA